MPSAIAVSEAIPHHAERKNAVDPENGANGVVELKRKHDNLFIDGILLFSQKQCNVTMFNCQTE
jgi:hypothetical protein